MRRRTFLFALSMQSLFRALRSRAVEPSLGLIAYVQEGGLWVRELPDGEPRQLSAGTQIHSPRFSPSGEWIVFQDREEMHLIHLNDRSVRHLTPGVCTWMPGRDVLAVANGEGLKFFSPLNGWSTPASVYRETSLPVFSPDSAQFVYSRAVEKGRGPGGEPIRDGNLYRVSLSDSEHQPQLLASKHLTDLLPYSWTRDAKSVLYWEDPDFSASVIADGLELVHIAVAGGSPKPLGVTTLVHDDMLALSPTQNALAVTVGEERESWSGKRIGIIDLDKASLRYLTDGNTSAICPSWSPDGNWIVYSASSEAVSEDLKRIHDPGTSRVLRPEDKPHAVPLTLTKRIGIGADQANPYLEKRRIWLVDVSTAAAPKQLTNDNHYRDDKAMWSANGTHILFCRMDRDGAGTLWLMRATGEDSVQVSGRLALGDDWFGYYGYIDWRRAFDWNRNRRALI